MPLNAGKNTPKKKSYWPILLIFCLYSISFTMVFPAFPTLLLNFTGDDSSLASEYFGTATCLKYFLEFFASPCFGALSDKVGRRPILLFSLFIMTIEFLLLAFFPSLYMIFITRAMSGMMLNVNVYSVYN